MTILVKTSENWAHWNYTNTLLNKKIMKDKIKEVSPIKYFVI